MKVGGLVFSGGCYFVFVFERVGLFVGYIWKFSRELGRFSRLRMSRGVRYSGKSIIGRRADISSGRIRL